MGGECFPPSPVVITVRGRPTPDPGQGVSGARGCGRSRSSRPTARQLHAYCNEAPVRRLLLGAEALEAMFHARLGCADRTLEALTRAVQVAEKDGWVRLLVDLGPDMARLLTQLARRGFAPHDLGHVLSAFPSSHGVPEPLPQTPAARLIEPLLERELDVLHLLAQRYSNKEIAMRLFIASSTVKRHTLSIYRKLEVSDRREAVARAAERRLLPPTNRHRDERCALLNDDRRRIGDG